MKKLASAVLLATTIAFFGAAAPASAATLHVGPSVVNPLSTMFPIVFP